MPSERGYRRPHPPLTRSPFSYKEKALGRSAKGNRCSKFRQAKRCRVARRGEAQRRQGWVGGVYPSAPSKARTAASDGHMASIRAARSAGLRFAVILLSKTMDVGRDHLIHRKRSPFPYEWKDLTRSNEGGTSPVKRNCPLSTVRFKKTRPIQEAYSPVSGASIAYCLLPNTLPSKSPAHPPP